jgi:xanthine dehydrogenase molybdopterin-binding subunit B
MLAISVYEALRDAIAATAGRRGPVKLSAPATAENVLTSLAYSSRHA